MYKKILCLIFLCVNFAFFAMEQKDIKIEQNVPQLLKYIKLGSNVNRPNVRRSLRRLLLARQKENISQESLEVADAEGDTLLHVFAKFGDAPLLSLAMQLQINRSLVNNQKQTAKEILLKMQSIAQESGDEQEKRDCMLCLQFYNSVQ